MTIVLDDLLFSAPVPLESYQGSCCQGLYDVLAGNQYGLLPFRHLYIGKSVNLAGRGFPYAHDHLAKWTHEKLPYEQLYIAICLAPHLTEEQLTAAEKRLIEIFQPPCNLQHNPASQQQTTGARSGLLAGFGYSTGHDTPRASGLLADEPVKRPFGGGILSPLPQAGGVLGRSERSGQSSYPTRAIATGWF